MNGSVIQRRAFRFAALGLLAAGISIAQDSEPPDPFSLSAEDLQSAVAATTLSLPTPGELFRSMAKDRRVSWRGYYRRVGSPPLIDRAKVSMHLGATLADLWMAAEARDSQHVRNLCHDAGGWHEQLGISKALAPRLARLIGLAESDAWTALRSEVEAYEIEITRALGKLRDADLARLVRVGMWLRALQVSAAAAEEEEAPQRLVPGDAIGGVGLLYWLLDQVNGASPSVRTMPSVRETGDLLRRLIWMWGDGLHSQEALRSRRERTSEMLADYWRQLSR